MIGRDAREAKLYMVLKLSPDTGRCYTKFEAESGDKEGRPEEAHEYVLYLRVPSPISLPVTEILNRNVGPSFHQPARKCRASATDWQETIYKYARAALA
jgi:hypothetical protein